MDDLPNILQDNYGLKKQGKAAPMAFQRKSSNPNLYQGSTDFGSSRSSPASRVNSSQNLGDDLFWGSNSGPNSNQGARRNTSVQEKPSSPFENDNLFGGSTSSRPNIGNSATSKASSRKYTDPFGQEDFFSSFSVDKNKNTNNKKNQNGNDVASTAAAFDEFVDSGAYMASTMASRKSPVSKDVLSEDLLGGFSKEDVSSKSSAPKSSAAPRPPPVDPFGSFSEDPPFKADSPARPSVAHSEDPFDPFFASKYSRRDNAETVKNSRHQQEATFTDFNSFDSFSQHPPFNASSDFPSFEQKKTFETPRNESSSVFDDFPGKTELPKSTKEAMHDSKPRTEAESRKAESPSPEGVSLPQEEEEEEEEEEWLTLENILLKTEPCSKPPPARPPPPIGAQKAPEVKNIKSKSRPSEPQNPEIKPTAKAPDAELKKPSRHHPKHTHNTSFPADDYYSSGMPRNSREKREGDLPPPSYYDTIGPDELDSLNDFAVGGRSTFRKRTGNGNEGNFSESAEVAGQSAAAMKEALEKARIKADNARKARDKEREKEREDAEAKELERRKSRGRNGGENAAERGKSGELGMDSKSKTSPSQPDMDDFFSGGPSKNSSRPTKKEVKKPTEKGPSNLDDLGGRPAEPPKRTAPPTVPSPPSTPPTFPPQPSAPGPTSAQSADAWADILGGSSVKIPHPSEAPIPGESDDRRKYRLEREKRIAEKAAEALKEKNRRDAEALREQAERDRAGEMLDSEIKKWAAGKQGNIRALLSTLQFVLWPECNWTPVSLTDLITGNAVKKAYRKATLCVHPDKVQQKGATVQQKYIAEKVFDLLKEAWNKFNAEELF